MLLLQLLLAPGQTFLPAREISHAIQRVVRIRRRLIRRRRHLIARLLIALELDTARVTARTACEVFLRHGILTKDTHQTVLRFAPPLVITREEIDEAMQGIRAALAALDADSK